MSAFIRKLSGPLRSMLLRPAARPAAPVQPEPALVWAAGPPAEVRPPVAPPAAPHAQQLSLYRDLFNRSRDAMVIADEQCKVIDVNPAWLRLTGLGRAETLGAPLLWQTMPPVTAPAADDWQRELLRDGAWQGELLVRHQQGGAAPCLIDIRALRLPPSGPTRFVAVCSDVSALREARALLEYQNAHDLLTGLPNRSLLQERMAWSLGRSQREARRMAVIYIDLDHFKLLNDGLGRAVGDVVLQESGRRIVDCVRLCDTTARAGADEFALLIEDVVNENDLLRLAERILAALATPVEVEADAHRVTASLGISLYPEDGIEPAQLLRNAELAMRRAKEAGKGCYEFYKPEMQARVRQRAELDRQLHYALDRGEFVLHYQPQVDLRTGQIAAFEALIRWQTPDGTLLGPGRFIPVAEESNLIHAIGEWVLQEACQALQRWQACGLRRVPIAVNLAASQFARQRIDVLVERVLAQTGVSPEWLELELTESVSMQDPVASIELMHKLKAMGLSLSIDDFGTGYSNMAYLSRFPVDKLKIDQSFVRGLTTGAEEKEIAAAVVQLAHALGMQVIAEGVEQRSQLQVLAAMGCDVMQGFYFSPAVEEAQAVSLLAAERMLDLNALSRAPYRRTILLVDDNTALRDAVAAMLEGEAFELLQAADPQAAYDLLAGHEVGVVITDYQMPQEDGITFLAKVKQMYPQTLRVLLTGYGSTELIAAAVQRGEIFRYIAKPLLRHEVMDTLRTAFQRYER